MLRERGVTPRDYIYGYFFELGGLGEKSKTFEKVILDIIRGKF